MEESASGDNPSKKRKADSATDTEDLGNEDAPTSVLDSINKKLDVLGVLHADVKDLKASLELAYGMMAELQRENIELRSSVATVSVEMEKIKTENKTLKETVLDIQSRSMQDNLIFSGISESAADNPESLIKNFMTTSLKIPPETVSTISFHRVHRLGARRGDRPRPIIAKFEHFKHKVLLKSKGRELKGTSFGMNDQFPREINERRKVLYPIMKQNRQKGKRATLVVDKLYIDNQLYRDPATTPWLF